MELNAATDIAEKFVAARHAGIALPDYPGALPDTLESAYAIQDAAIARFGGTISGWKVGRIHPPLSIELGTDRLAGPIFSGSVQQANNHPQAGKIFEGGFGAVEAEFLIQLDDGIKLSKTNYTLEEAAAHIEAVHVGIEIASSPFPGINALGPLITISDFGNNNGIIIGDIIEGWQDSSFANWTVTLTIDGVESGTGKATAFPDGPIGSVRFLLENLASRGIAIPAGTWVSSGAVTGVHAARVGQQVSASFGGQFSINCTIEAATAS